MLAKPALIQPRSGLQKYADSSSPPSLPFLPIRVISAALLKSAAELTGRRSKLASSRKRSDRRSGSAETEPGEPACNEPCTLPFPCIPVVIASVHVSTSFFLASKQKAEQQGTVYLLATFRVAGYAFHAPLSSQATLLVLEFGARRIGLRIKFFGSV